MAWDIKKDTIEYAGIQIREEPAWSGLSLLCDTGWSIANNNKDGIDVNCMKKELRLTLPEIIAISLLLNRFISEKACKDNYGHDCDLINILK